MPEPSYRTTVATWCAAVAGYALLTCLLTWPLPRHLDTHLLGRASGDTGVYVWNLWIFRHELVSHGHLPFSTDHLFAYTGGSDFALHNYTPLAGLMALPLVGPLGLVATYNLLLLAFVALSGTAMFLLARQIGLGRLAAWLAGALFIASPVLTSKETAHFSLVTAAPLPLFLWALLRTLDSRRVRDAVLVGTFAAVASYSDAYYGIYCGLMGSVLVAWRFLRVERYARSESTWVIERALEMTLVTSAAVIAWRIGHGASDLVVGSTTISLHTLYTPVLFLVVVVVLRGWLAWRPVVRLDDPDRVLPILVRRGLVSVGVCLALMLPLVVGIALQFLDDRLPQTEIYWRSSPRGVDAFSYFVPNPNHPWFGGFTRTWFMPDRPDAYPEYVASFSIVALMTIALGAWYRVLPRLWVTFTAIFVALSLGPFVHVAGINTYVIGPWALLRYVPVIEMARSPSRFAIVAALGFCLLCAIAAQALWRRGGRIRWALSAVALAALAFEVLPAPRPLYSAAVPMVFDMISATDDDSGRVLELPTGIRDGTSSMGNFNPASEYFQTRHHRPVIGGYLSRVSRSRKSMNRRVPMLRTLFELSEGHTVPPEQLDEARRSADAFLRRACIKFVVVDKARASDELRAFAVDSLGLKPVHDDEEYALYTVSAPPPCDPRRLERRRWKWRLAGQLP